MPTFNFDNLDFDGVQVTEFGQILPEVSLPINRFGFRVFGGVKVKTNYGVNNLPGVLGTGRIGCDPTPIDGSLSVEQRTVDPQEYNDDIGMCYADLNDYFTRAFNGVAPENWDLQGGVLNYAAETYTPELERTALRYLWFGDTAAALAPGGTVTPANLPGVPPTKDNTDLLNIIDGIWKILVDRNIAAPTELIKIAIQKNTEPTEELQLDLADNYTKDLLDEMYKKGHPELVNNLRSEIYMTRELYCNYEDTLIQRNNQSDSGFQTLENGIRVDYLMYKGIRIYRMDHWTRDIATFFNDGTVLDNPNRILWAMPDNQVMATDGTYEDLLNMMFFNIVEKKKVVARHGSLIDAQVDNDRLSMFAI